MKYQASNSSYQEKEFDTKKDTVQDMLNFIDAFAKSYLALEDFQTQLLIVGDEILSNIIKHGYQNNGGTIDIRLHFDVNRNEFTLTIIDHARAFNQLSVNNLTYANGKPLEEGGLGLAIVKNIMSECAYDRINDKNILVFKKSFNIN